MKSVSEVFNEICAFEDRVGLFYESVSAEVKQQYGKFFDKLAEDEYRHSKIYKALGEKAVRDERIILTDEDAVFMRSMFANSTLGEDFDFK